MILDALKNATAFTLQFVLCAFVVVEIVLFIISLAIAILAVAEKAKLCVDKRCGSRAGSMAKISTILLLFIAFVFVLAFIVFLV